MYFYTVKYYFSGVIINVRTLNGLQIFIPQLTNNGQLDLRYVRINENQEVIGEKHFSSGIRLGNPKIPLTKNSPGISGQITWDSKYIYICYSGNGSEGKWAISPLLVDWAN